MNVPIPVPLPMFSFTGSRHSYRGGGNFYGWGAGRGEGWMGVFFNLSIFDLFVFLFHVLFSFFRKQGIHFYTQVKTITSSWKYEVSLNNPNNPNNPNDPNNPNNPNNRDTDSMMFSVVYLFISPPLTSQAATDAQKQTSMPILK